MAKELHIKIDKQIGGLFIDEDEWLSPGYSSNELEYALSEMPNPTRLIIHASSPGGDIEQGFKIYNRLLDLRNSGTEIHVINEAKAYSIMTFIAMAASPGKLFARKASMWSVHKPMAVVFDMLNADELRKISKELDSFESVMLDAYVSRTGKDKSKIEAELREDIIINSSEALEQGWIDEVLDDEPATAQKLESARMVAWKPVAFLPKPELQTINNKETNMAENKEAVNFIAKVKAFANEILGLTAEGETTTESTETTTGTEGGTTTTETTETTTTVDPKDVELEQLRAENQRLKDEAAAKAQESDEAMQALKVANEAMAHMKTTFVPQARQNSFEKVGGEQKPVEKDLKAELAARKAARNAASK